MHELASPLYKGSKERDNSWGGAAVHGLVSPLYKGSKERGNSWGGAAVHELVSLIYKGSKEKDNSWGCAAVEELAPPLTAGAEHELASLLYKGSIKDERQDVETYIRRRRGCGSAWSSCHTAASQLTGVQCDRYTSS